MNNRPKLPPYQRKTSCIDSLYGKLPLQSTMSSSSVSVIPEKYAADLPKGMVPLQNQVAGHTFQTGTDAIGLLKDQHDGSVLKPATKPLCGIREIKFYENLENKNDPCLNILKEFVPEYRGTIRMHMGGRDIDFIKLTDLTHDMLEPCIMDIKIGKRTWDPLASEEKRLAEEQKYSACKQTLGLCIPGFQVHSISTGRLKKYDKDYGKKLNEKTIKDAIRIFLNADSGLNRGLIMHFLSALWSVQKWARTQKLIKLYSSSLLLVYDARRLRSNLQSNRKSRNSLTNSNGSLTSQTASASPQRTDLNGCTSPFSFPVTSNIEPPIQSFRRVQRSHSMQNNYDDDLKKIRENYLYMLDNLVGNNEKKEWAFVKLIDFAHVFPSEDGTVDTNYLFGVNNLVKIFEDFLKDSE